MFRLVRCLLLLLSVVGLCSCHFTDEWAVEIEGGDEVAEKVATKSNCVIVDKIFDDTYLFRHKRVSKRSVNPHQEAHDQIEGHSEVRWTEQQKVLSRKKRDVYQKRQLWRFPQQQQQQQQQQMPQDQYVDILHLNDQRWPQMWYLNRGDRLDMNVQSAWASGATGKGISVTILDDGIERTHPDLVANYDPLASFDVNHNDNDPTPRYDLIDSNRHGTRCAGEVSASANNSECAVGIAFEAGIGGVRMLDGDVTDAVEARSLGLNNQHIHIYSASWGPDDDGKTVDGPGRLATRAFVQGISQGRNGKGSIFVWASGNGGRDHDNCNCDGYTNSVWTLSVSSATENGLIPWYSEACSSTLATTYSSGSAGERKVVTTDLHHLCTSSHTGTSASAPLAAGIMALVLQVNPDLSWRDVQHLTVRCAHVANLKATDWAVNGVGRNFSHSFGYGIMDASCMVSMAKQWTSVPEQQTCSVPSKDTDVIIPGKSTAKATLEVKDCQDLKFLEHVQAHVTLTSSKRGDVLIYLVSPSGTRSNLVAKRPRDYSRAGFKDWPFLTVHMWEESPIGTWTLEVQNDGRSVVELKSWSLVFLGTNTHPQPNAKEFEVISTSAPLPAPTPEPAQPNKNNTPSPSIPPHQEILEDKIPNCEQQSDPEFCIRCTSGFVQLEGRCVDECPVQEGFFFDEKRGTCNKCYYACKTCTGANDYECLTCYGDAKLEEKESGKYCYNKSLIQMVFSSSRWYYVLSMGFMVNFFIVIVLIVYILRWRRSRNSDQSSLQSSIAKLNPASKMYLSSDSKFKLGGRRTSLGGGGNKGGVSATAAGGGTVPFYDFDSSSEEAEEFLRKPYTDEER